MQESNKNDKRSSKNRLLRWSKCPNPLIKFDKIFLSTQSPLFAFIFGLIYFLIQFGALVLTNRVDLINPLSLSAAIAGISFIVIWLIFLSRLWTWYKKFFGIFEEPKKPSHDDKPCPAKRIFTDVKYSAIKENLEKDLGRLPIVLFLVMLGSIVIQFSYSIYTLWMGYSNILGLAVTITEPVAIFRLFADVMSLLLYICVVPSLWMIYVTLITINRVGRNPKDFEIINHYEDLYELLNPDKDKRLKTTTPNPKKRNLKEIIVNAQLFNRKMHFFAKFALFCTFGILIVSSLYGITLHLLFVAIPQERTLFTDQAYLIGAVWVVLAAVFSISAFAISLLPVSRIMAKVKENVIELYTDFLETKKEEFCRNVNSGSFSQLDINITGLTRTFLDEAYRFPNSPYYFSYVLSLASITSIIILTVFLRVFFEKFLG